MAYELEFRSSPDQYKQAAQAQRDYARRIADKLDRDEPIDAIDGHFTAPILRAWADNLKDTPPRNRGHQPKIDPSNVALWYHLLILRGKRKSAAIRELAEGHGVTIEAIRQAIKTHSVAASVFLERFGAKQKK